jgi:hypothetical protein
LLLGQLPPRTGHSIVAFGKNLFVLVDLQMPKILCDDFYMLDVGKYHAIVDKILVA